MHTFTLSHKCICFFIYSKIEMLLLIKTTKTFENNKQIHLRLFSSLYTYKSKFTKNYVIITIYTLRKKCKITQLFRRMLRKITSSYKFFRAYRLRFVSLCKQNSYRYVKLLVLSLLSFWVKLNWDNYDRIEENAIFLVYKSNIQIKLNLFCQNRSRLCIPIFSNVINDWKYRLCYSCQCCCSKLLQFFVKNCNSYAALRKVRNMLRHQKFAAFCVILRIFLRVYVRIYRAKGIIQINTDYDFNA